MTKPISIPQLTEEPLASVLRVLQLEENGADTFTAHSLPQMNRVYGGQVIAQALLAAAATLDEQSAVRTPHSFHAYFLRGGAPHKPFDISVHRAHDGRSFSSRQVRAVQHGKDILTLLASFQLHQPGLEHNSTMPTVDQPEQLQSAIEYFRTINHPVGKFLGKTAAFDVRHVQESLYSRASTKRERRQQLWMKPRARIDSPTQTVSRALLAYVVDQVMMEPALRAHGLAWLTPGLALASLDHAMWFHRDFNINEWMLYDQESPSAQGSRAMGRVRIYSRDGTLIAEAMQEAMIRLPEEGTAPSSKWTFSDDSSADVGDQ
ncbi:MAG: thioesterase family protein [Actinomycetaceae bacterium]|nr:thioesterase family protein [Actinomycetaceae bacterium]